MELRLNGRYRLFIIVIVSLLIIQALKISKLLSADADKQIQRNVFVLTRLLTLVCLTTTKNTIEHFILGGAVN